MLASSWPNFVPGSFELPSYPHPGSMPSIPGGQRGGSSHVAGGRKSVRLGQRYQDLDPRRPHRVGTVVSVERTRARIRWDSSGHTTTVQRSHLDGSGSRGYVLIDEPKAPPPPLGSRLTTVEECRAGRSRAGAGARLWRCFGCGRKGTLRPPWRVLLWKREAPTRGTVVCGATCQAIARTRALQGS